MQIQCRSILWEADFSHSLRETRQELHGSKQSSGRGQHKPGISELTELTQLTQCSSQGFLELTTSGPPEHVSVSTQGFLIQLEKTINYK